LRHVSIKQKAIKTKKKVSEEGEAFKKTLKADAKDENRNVCPSKFCRCGNGLRKESEMGGLNDKGHVRTYEQS
jgi:hypothetical protein